MNDVAFSCDDNGAKFLRVAVYSLLAHYRGSERLRINVFEGYGGHSAENKHSLAEVVGRFPFAEVRYHDVEPVLKPYIELIGQRDGSRWNVFTWTPVFTPAIIADATGNVIHFDIDMLFNADISPLFELDLGDDLIATTYEYHRCSGKVESVIWEKGILPESVERYFNTGVLVFNYAKCREERTWEKIVEWYRANYTVADRIEQDAWNALYWNRNRALPVEWNFHDRNMKGYAKWSIADKYWLGNSPRECLAAALEPKILHFWGPKKPWKPSHRPYRKLYHAAMRAVGLEAPREQLLSPYYNLINGWHFRRIRLRLRGSRPINWVYKLKCLKRSLRAPFEWMGIALGVAVMSSLSHRALFGFCDFLSWIVYHCDRRGRRRALETLRIVFNRCTGLEGDQVRFDPDVEPYNPSRAEDRIIRRSYRNMARTIGHIFWTCRKAKERAAEIGEMSDECRNFLQTHKPAVTVSAHLGCWEILSQLAFLEGHVMMSVAKKIGTRGLTKFLMKARMSIGQEIIPVEGAMKTLLRGIENGKSLGLLVDQSVEPKHGGIWVRFFGRPISVSAAPAFFAAKSKVPIAVAWSRPLKNGHYRCELIDVITPAEARDIRGTTQRCARDFEKIIRRHPSCWVMNYNFYSNIPSAKDIESLP